ncbi:MAG: hypothetical protein ACOYW7_11470 [Nitrospirota bacterium]
MKCRIKIKVNVSYKGQDDMSAHQLTDLLIANFEVFLDAFRRYCPFKKYGQLQCHIRTIELRRDLGSAQAAINDEKFLLTLYDTLQAWGIGARRSKLKPFSDFAKALESKASEIAEFENIKISNVLDAAVTGKKLARLIHNLGVVDNKSRIVAGTKALHHLLPELVVPIDREYTQQFFGWHNPQFQNFPQECFVEAFENFIRISRAVDLSQYRGEDWFSSETKIIDNAIVGFWRWIKFDAHKIIANKGVDPNAASPSAQVTP